jgi:hypothetical protein
MQMLTLAPATRVAGAGSHGVVVTNLNPGGPAAEIGVRIGDIILDVSGKAVEYPLRVAPSRQRCTVGWKARRLDADQLGKLDAFRRAACR